MATGKNTKGKTNNGGSQANVQHHGLMALESRVLFSAAALVSDVPEPVNDDAAAIEASLVPGERFAERSTDWPWDMLGTEECDDGGKAWHWVDRSNGDSGAIDHNSTRSNNGILNSGLAGDGDGQWLRQVEQAANPHPAITTSDEVPNVIDDSSNESDIAQDTPYRNLPVVLFDVPGPFITESGSVGRIGAQSPSPSSPPTVFLPVAVPVFMWGSLDVD